LPNLILLGKKVSTVWMPNCRKMLYLA